MDLPDPGAPTISRLWRPAAAISRALADAGMAPEEVGYINAHGTSTPVGDVGEVVVLLVQSDELLSRAPLEYVRRATAFFSDAPFVERVESLAATPLARRARARTDPATDATLDDLDDLGAN